MQLTAPPPRTDTPRVATSAPPTPPPARTARPIETAAARALRGPPSTQHQLIEEGVSHRRVEQDRDADRGLARLPSLPGVQGDTALVRRLLLRPSQADALLVESPLD